MKVRLHPEARAELREARHWYFERSPLSAIAFAHDVDHAVARIREARERYPPADHGTRKFVLQRFPFSVLYRVGTDEINYRRGSTPETPSWILVESSR
jgi:plasmid stabilization system protein ParE